MSSPSSIVPSIIFCTAQPIVSVNTCPALTAAATIRHHCGLYQLLVALSLCTILQVPSLHSVLGSPRSVQREAADDEDLMDADEIDRRFAADPEVSAAIVLSPVP